MDSFVTRWNALAMPNAPRTPNRSVRVSEVLWSAAKAIATGRGETMTDVVVRALETYVRTNGESS
jgi:hypothetical protein